MPYGVKNGTVNGTDFVSFGRGEDALLLIPGLGDGLRTVKGMALSLSWLYREYAKAYRVYVFSRRNALPEGFTIRDMADDLKGAMDALGLRRGRWDRPRLRSRVRFRRWHRPTTVRDPIRRVSGRSGSRARRRQRRSRRASGRCRCTLRSGDRKSTRLNSSHWS